ncbi:MAG: phosphatidate cytidylyltransferase [Rhodobacteraceae bacterium]|nr:MAG: phosphatidate cytidylyltransferase [Paracoccaceae bacterium]
MTRAPASFTDLRARTLSAVVMIAIGAGAIWAGGVLFVLAIAVVCALMGWELARMLAPKAAFGQAEGIALGLALALLGAVYLVAAPLLSLALLLATAILAGVMLGQRAVSVPYLALILFAGFGLIVLRADFGLLWVLWLVALVIGSDVAGYFAGRILGGPKLWPRVSPKKTWSGTVAGWLLAAAIGAGFTGPLGAGAGLIVVSVLVAMAGQAGDIAESAIKRHAGVKDSSNLIPGHGGVLDRFDAMIASALMVLIMAQSGFLG